MANSRSALKRSRQTDKRTIQNRSVRTRVKSTRRALNVALESGDRDAATAKFRALTSAADKAAKTGVIHKNTASRIKGLYTRRIAALKA